MVFCGRRENLGRELEDQVRSNKGEALYVRADVRVEDDVRNLIATTAHRSAYTASKRGLVGHVQSAALDYVSQNIRINALIPGTTDTPLVCRAGAMEHAPDAVWQVASAEWAKSHTPLGRLATAQEIAAFAVTLASDEHPFMTGAQLVIDGGKTAQAG